MARKPATDTVDNNGVEEQPSQERSEQSEPQSSSRNHCDMCDFLFEGYRNAHSKQAKAEYGEGFLNHFVKFHKKLWDEIN